MRHGDDHVGIFRPGLAQHTGRCRIADDRPQVELVLQLHQARPVAIDDGNVVFFRDQPLGHAGANLASAKNDDFHATPFLLWRGLVRQLFFAPLAEFDVQLLELAIEMCALQPRSFGQFRHIAAFKA